METKEQFYEAAEKEFGDNIKIDVIPITDEAKAKYGDELNDRIIRTIENTRFDVGRIPPEWYDTWFYYTKEVIMPREYRQ